jgi:hypothetical protein
MSTTALSSLRTTTWLQGVPLRRSHVTSFQSTDDIEFFGRYNLQNCTPSSQEVIADPKDQPPANDPCFDTSMRFTGSCANSTVKFYDSPCPGLMNGAVVPRANDEDDVGYVFNCSCPSDTPCFQAYTHLCVVPVQDRCYEATSTDCRVHKAVFVVTCNVQGADEESLVILVFREPRVPRRRAVALRVNCSLLDVTQSLYFQGKAIKNLFTRVKKKENSFLK